jgi:LysM repeat protein
VLALGALVATVAAALVLLASLNGPSGAAAQRSTGPVTVRPGDTLWSIAERVAPGTDPRAEVAELRRLNGLAGPDGVRLTPGQVLRTR